MQMLIHGSELELEIGRLELYQYPSWPSFSPQNAPSFAKVTSIARTLSWEGEGDVAAFCSVNDNGCSLQEEPCPIPGPSRFQAMELCRVSLASQNGNPSLAHSPGGTIEFEVQS